MMEQLLPHLEAVRAWGQQQTRELDTVRDELAAHKVELSRVNNALAERTRERDQVADLLAAADDIRNALVTEVGELKAEIAAMKAAADSRGRLVPAGAGYVDAAAHGAKLDGTADDTAAIQEAIGAWVGQTNAVKTVLLPRGRAKVTSPLAWRLNDPKASNGGYRAYLALAGVGPGKSIIQVPANSPGAGVALELAPVLFTASGDVNDVIKTPGGGNEGFCNVIERLSIDTGAGNVGAVAIDLVVSNWGGVRDVEVETEGVGVGLLRPYQGPGLIKRLRVRGGRVGIDSAQRHFTMALEDVELTGQPVAINNTELPLCVRKLKADGKIWTGGPLWLIDSPGVSDAQLSGPGQVIRASKLNLPEKETPEAWPESEDDIAYVEAGTGDDTVAIHAALHSGRPFVVFEGGFKFSVDSTLLVPPHVVSIIGSRSCIALDPGVFETATPTNLFRVAGGGRPLVVQQLHTVSGKQGRGAIWFDHVGPRDLSLVDCYFGTGTIYRNGPDSGDLFAENVHSQGAWFVGWGKSAWLRQFNPESLQLPDWRRTKLTVGEGARAWVFALKTEGSGRIVDVLDGGQVEVIGGVACWNKPMPEAPFAVRHGGRLALSVAHAELKSGMKPAVMVEELGAGGTSRPALPAKDVKGRVVEYVTQ